MSPKANPRARKQALVVAAILHGALAAATGASGVPPEEAADPPASPSESPSELTLIPAFPGGRLFQLRFETDVIPSASLDDQGSVTTVRPGLRLRAAAPVTDRLTAQVVARYASTLYAFDGRQPWFGVDPPPLGTDPAPASNPFDDLHDARVSLQAAFELNRESHLLFTGERWSLLGEILGGARWERGAFDDGLHAGGGMALSYEYPRRLRIVLGFAVRTQVAQSGLRAVPIFSARWRVTDQLTLRSRGRGAQIEYQWSRRLMTYAAAFKTGSSWRLDRRVGVPSSAVLNDKQVRVGLGLEWRPHRQLRLHLEAGAVTSRELEVDVRGGGSLSQIDASPSAYLVVSLELRP